MWFSIKAHPRFTNGAGHVFRTMQLIRLQPKEAQGVTRKAVQNNAYFAHPENLLAGMLVDNRKPIREKAVDKILAARKRWSHQSRVFRVPPLNWEAESYDEIVSLAGHVTEPPVTRQMTEQELQSARDDPPTLPEFPCHSQSVERCVKMVTEASRAVFGQERRHALILSRQAARKVGKAHR